MDRSQTCPYHLSLTNNDQKVFKGFSLLWWWLMLGCCVIALLLSEKAVGPGDPGKAPWQQLGALSRCCLSITPRYMSVHCLSLGTSPKWAQHLPNSLNISFLQIVVPEPSLLLHSKEGGGGRLLQSLSVRHHICAKHTRCCSSSK